MPKPKNNKIKPLKRKKPIYKFDMKRIIKEREAERKKNPAFDDIIQNASILNLEEIKKTINVSKNNELPSILPKLEELDVVDMSKYNIPLTNDPDSTKSCLHRLHIMSIELNEIAAKTHFNFLMNADWIPVLKDFEDVLRNWCPDLVSLIKNKSLLKHKTKDSDKVGRHNFELVLRFIYYSVIKIPNGFNDNDLLTLAKYTVKMYFDPHCRQVNNVKKKLFNICTETALNKAKNTAIKSFAQELYSNHPVEDLSEMIVDLFLPIEGTVMEKIYSYLTYSIFKTLLGKNNKNTLTFPKNINNWFVQDLVDNNYFKQNSIEIAYSVINLLEHVVTVFDLYANHEKLSIMYEFLYTAIRQNELSDSQIYINKIDQWRLRLDSLHIKCSYAKESSEEQSHR